MCYLTTSLSTVGFKHVKKDNFFLYEDIAQVDYHFPLTSSLAGAKKENQRLPLAWSTLKTFIGIAIQGCEKTTPPGDTYADKTPNVADAVMLIEECVC